jgi:hypothetical protein
MADDEELERCLRILLSSFVLISVRLSIDPIFYQLKTTSTPTHNSNISRPKILIVV